MLAVAKPNGVLSMTEGTTKGVATLRCRRARRQPSCPDPGRRPLARGVGASTGPGRVRMYGALEDAPRARFTSEVAFAARRWTRRLAVGVAHGASLAGPTIVDEPIQKKPAETEVEALASNADFACPLPRPGPAGNTKSAPRAALGFPLVGMGPPPKKRVIETSHGVSCSTLANVSAGSTCPARLPGGGATCPPRAGRWLRCQRNTGTRRH